jgi:Flp pilus assembly pilin Flp
MRLNLLTNQKTTEKESSMERVNTLIIDDTAASSVEYGLLMAGIALAVLGSIMAVGQAVYDKLYSPALGLFK